MTPNLTNIFGIGVSCLDFICPIEEGFLTAEQVGEKGGSCNISLSEFDRILAKCNNVFKAVPGGSAANTIRALAKMGEKCTFFSHTGQDDYANVFIKDLQQYGIIPLVTKVASYSTARALCLITPDGERTVRCCDQKVSVTISANLFSNCKLAHFEARRLASSHYVEETMQAVKSAGGAISLDLSSFETALQHQETLLHLITNYVDVLFGNEDEIMALAQCPAQQGILKLQKICPTIVVTLGAKGSLSAVNNTVYPVPAFPAHVIDTTGAGDFFAAGFLYGYLHNYSWQKCLLLGNRIAGHSVEAWGATISEKQWEQIISFIEQLQTCCQ